MHVNDATSGNGGTPPPAAAPPTVSVVISAYSDERWDALRDAVTSVRGQTRPAHQVIVSVDHNPALLQRAHAEWPDGSVVLVENSEPQGLSGARNAGIALATSDLIAFLDVDDLWPHGMLLTLVREWAVGGADVVIGRAQVVEIDPTTAVELPVGTPDTAFPHYIGSAVYDRRVFDRVGTFDAQMMFGEDTDWFTRLAESGTALRRLSAVTLVVRRHGQNMTEGRDLVELHVVRAVKKALDRKRDREHTP